MADELTLEHLLQDIRTARDSEPSGRPPLAVQLGKRQLAAVTASIVDATGLPASDPAVGPLTSIDGYRVIETGDDDHFAVLFEDPAPTSAASLPAVAPEQAASEIPAA